MKARPVERRRRRDALLLLVGVVAVGLTALLGAVLGTPGERIPRMWVGAEMRADGTARITEVIDYDFAGEQRHGIYRDIPRTDPGDVSDVTVTVDGAPVPHRVEDDLDERIVIGDADTTVTGVHRYRIAYTLPRLGDEEWLAWDAVGTRWDVPVGHVDVHLAAPFALDRTSCSWGPSGSMERCTAQRKPVPGQLDVSQDGLDAHEGLTLYAKRAADGAGGASALPEAPGGRAAAVETGDGAVAGWLWATVTALAAAAVVAELVRLAGRWRVRTADGRIRRMDVSRLRASVTPSGEPPAGISPAHAGILLGDRVSQEHLTAWLLTAAADGHLTIKGTKRPVLHQVLHRADELPGGGADDPLTAEVLRAVFARKQRVPLGQYNTAFATAWKLLRQRLETWRRTGGDGLWEPKGERRRRIALWGGAVTAVAGTVVVGIAATAVPDPGAHWRTPLAIGAALAGGGLGALVRSRELRARTVLGSRLWCEAEAYRRHLAAHGRPGGETDTDDELTAWAVALGATEGWTAAADRANTPGSGAGAGASRAGSAVPAQLAVYLPAAALLAATQPSSGGSGSSSGSSHSGYSGYSGGGDSGGVGGGDGGGGGGSW
ncbi:Predicted membrane protein (DUF2207) [Streptomyces sp. LamerLS-316]|uniref:DUF2207 domain-containing protein n=1 Tax=unclassified Streptomyces TaxID=2593676 RepID=UPI000823BD16|nr:DUF2207 domain-containing protein [Streptomyces sp. LamerLS-316]MYQ37495.1 DUF2207 domain-containing protein [Streptomyces sp. SID4921]SCK44956.1 Predicted membrane protein (DUF2207) [Streptomyces sp. LamerLS-316]